MHLNVLPHNQHVWMILHPLTLPVFHIKHLVGVRRWPQCGTLQQVIRVPSPLAWSIVLK